MVKEQRRFGVRACRERARMQGIAGRDQTKGAFAALGAILGNSVAKSRSYVAIAILFVGSNLNLGPRSIGKNEQIPDVPESSMSRELTCVLMTIVASACAAVGSTAVWHNIARSTEGQPLVTKVDFDQVFASVNATPRTDYAPTILTKTDLDQVFASMTERPHRENTPANREKLRDAGWKRIL
jgi:hypothetical protein